MNIKNQKYIVPIGLLLALLVIGVTFAVNLSGAVYGGPASVGQLIMTIIYTAFWCVFTWFSVKYVPLRKIVFVISLLTLLSAAVSFLCVSTNQGFVIEALMSVFVSVPFYGARNFTSWEGLYGCVFAVSLVWFAFAARQLRKNKK